MTTVENATATMATVTRFATTAAPAWPAPTLERRADNARLPSFLATVFSASPYSSGSAPEMLPSVRLACCRSGTIVLAWPITSPTMSSTSPRLSEMRRSSDDTQ